MHQWVSAARPITKPNTAMASGSSVYLSYRLVANGTIAIADRKSRFSAISAPSNLRRVSNRWWWITQKRPTSAKDSR